MMGVLAECDCFSGDEKNRTIFVFTPNGWEQNKKQTYRLAYHHTKLLTFRSQ